MSDRVLACFLVYGRLEPGQKETVLPIHECDETCWRYYVVGTALQQLVEMLSSFACFEILIFVGAEGKLQWPNSEISQTSIRRTIS